MREGSLSGAARTLRLAQPTLGRHVEAMEMALGGKLFLRSRAGLSPTELAGRIMEPALAMEAAANSLARAASGGEGAVGTVRITASRIMANRALPPILASIRQQHPGLRFELEASDTQSDLLRHDADIAVRMARPTQKDLIARKAGTVTVGLFAHRDWISQTGKPGTLADAAQAGGFIGYDRNPVIDEILNQAGIVVQPSHFALRTDDDGAILAAIEAGLGVGPCQVGFAGPELVRVLAQIAFPLDVWLVTHPDLAREPRITAAMAGLARGLSAFTRKR
jgi:DNA-binding transcriptional LysR family regulator